MMHGIFHRLCFSAIRSRLSERQNTRRNINPNIKPRTHSPKNTLLDNESTTSNKLRLPSFSHFPLYSKIFDYLSSAQIHTPTYIQYALLSHLTQNPQSLAPYHIVSPTGSGKTLAYLLPIINTLKRQQEIQGIPLTMSYRPRVLILTSTKQLVLQCRSVCKDIAHHVKLRVDAVNIGRNMNDEREILQKGVDVLISTHQRVKNAFKRDQIKLNNLSYVVVDEVDTLYDNDRLEQIMEGFIKPLSKKTKIILSSTTVSQDLRQYIDKSLQHSVRLQDRQTHINLSNIKHQFTQCFTLDKHEKVLEIILQQKKTKTIVFCNTVKSLNELEYYLNNQGLTLVTMHSKLPKMIRLQNYQTFRDIEGGLMLSTDLGARGLDFPHLDRVINYDFPLSTVDYLQRVGRTGRAGRKGLAISIYKTMHLPIIKELRDASFHSPLKISNSAYAFKNRENIGRNKYTKDKK